MCCVLRWWCNLVSVCGVSLPSPGPQVSLFMHFYKWWPGRLSVSRPLWYGDANRAAVLWGFCLSMIYTHSIKLTTMRLKDQRQSYATWATSMARWLNQAIPVLTTSLALVSHWAPLITSIFPSVPGDVAAPLLLLLTAAWNWLKWQLARYSNSVMSALQRVYLQFNFRDCLIWQVMSEHNWKSDFKTLLFLSQHSIMFKLTIDAQGQAGIIVSSVQGTCSWHSPTSGCLYFESIILPSQQSSNTWTNISKFCNITSILIIFPASVPLKSLE